MHQSVQVILSIELKIDGKQFMKEGLKAINFDTAFLRVWVPDSDDFDILDHVNNAVYVRWVQEIAVLHWNHVASDALRDANLFIVLRHEIDYRNPILPGDCAEVRTWLGTAKGPRFDRYVDIRKPGSDRAAAVALTTWCMIDVESRRPKRVGHDVLDAFGLTL